MPFTPIQTLDCKADVKIFFSGLLMLTPFENDSCEVFVHTSAPRHYLTIEVRRKQDAQMEATRAALKGSSAGDRSACVRAATAGTSGGCGR